MTTLPRPEESLNYEEKLNFYGNKRLVYRLQCLLTFFIPIQYIYMLRLNPQ